MSILRAIQETIALFERESAKPCEIAIDGKAFAALECEVGERAVVAIHEELGPMRVARIRTSEKPAMIIAGVRIVRCEDDEYARNARMQEGWR